MTSFEFQELLMIASVFSKLSHLDKTESKGSSLYSAGNSENFSPFLSLQIFDDS